MEMKILAIAITAVVVITVLAGVLMPVLADATETEKTYTNDGVFLMTDDPTNYTLEYKGVDGELWVNGEFLMRFTDLPNSTWTLISTPEYVIRMQGASNNYTCWLTSVSGTNTYVAQNTTASATITVTGSTMKVGNTTVDYTGEFRGIAKNGDYVMTSTGGFIVSDKDTIIIGNGTTTVTHWYDAFYIIGTIDDINVYSSDSITVSDVQVNADAINGFNGSVVNNITFTATDGTNSVDAVYDRVIVPAEVTIEKIVRFTDGQNAIFAAIPIMVIIALLIAIVAMVFRSRQF